MKREWYNVTLQRKLNTEYRNTTGEELELHAYSRRHENTYGFTAVIYNESGGHKLNPLASVIINGYQHSDRRAGLYVTIPDGAYYQIRHNASVFLQAVNELRATPPSEEDETEPEPEEPEEPEVPVDPEPEPEEPTNPIIREEWESTLNTPPNVNALKENGTLKMGTGIRGTYATVANDGVIELTLVPAIPGRKVVGPIGSDGIFTKTEEGDVSCTFAVTSLEHPLNDVIDLYDSITLDVISDGELVQKLDLQLHNNGWFNEAGEMLEGTYIDEYTIQEATRVSFFTERGKEHKFVLTANTKEDSESIEVTVIDEYVEPEPEPEPEPEVPAEPEPEVPAEPEPEVPEDPDPVDPDPELP